jgi:hypothetical protein
VKKPQQRTALLLDNAVDLMFQIYLLRGDCSQAARSAMNNAKCDEDALEDCARLDDALAKAFKSIQNSVRTIQKSRASRRRKVAE